MLSPRFFRGCLGVFLGLAGLAGAQDKAGTLDWRLRQLEKDIAAVRALPFKAPVNARIIPRPKDAELKTQGYYSPREKTLFLYNDISGAYQKGVLIHEMVHALQDQHFDLAKMKARLHQAQYDSDAERALAALIEGDATYTMIEVLKKEQPKVAGMLNVPLAKAKNLDGVFLYAEGARYVKALKERGGWALVNLSYKMPPRNTASVLNQKTVLATDLGPGQVQGELGLMKVLAGHPRTRERAFTAVKGWRGDRIVPTEPAQGTAWDVVFAAKENAQAFHSALTALKTAQHPDFTLQPAGAPGVVAARNQDGALWGVLHRDRHVHVLEAPDVKRFQILRDYLEGRLSLTVWPAGAKVQGSEFGLMIDHLLGADVICIGETHNALLHHRVQLQILKALHALDDRLAVGMEMYYRPFQESVDHYIRGETSEEEFLKASEYAKRWGYDYALYKPLVDFCRHNRLPVAALNAPKELTARISKVGYTGLNEVEKKQLGPIDFHVKKHRDHWFEELPKLHGQEKATPEQKERSYQVMAVWDDFMAQSAARFIKERHLRRLVILAGSGHIDHRFGIPDRVAKHAGVRVATVKIVTAGDKTVTGLDAPADFVIVVR